jgi:hypothetical protein
VSKQPVKTESDSESAEDIETKEENQVERADSSVPQDYDREKKCEKGQSRDD